jgi:hypothetical protein
MHGVIELEQELVKLTSDYVQQNCAKCTKPLPFLALRQRLPTLSLQARTLASLKQIIQHEYYNPRPVLPAPILLY